MVLKRKILASLLALVLSGSSYSAEVDFRENVSSAKKYTAESISEFCKSTRTRYDLELVYDSSWRTGSAVLETRVKENDYSVKLDLSGMFFDFLIRSEGFVDSRGFHPTEYLHRRTILSLFNKSEITRYDYEGNILVGAHYHKEAEGDDVRRFFSRYQLRNQPTDFLSELVKETFRKSKDLESEDSWVIKDGLIGLMSFHRYSQQGADYAVIKINDQWGREMYPKDCRIRFGADGFMEQFYARELSADVKSFKLTKK